MRPPVVRGAHLCSFDDGPREALGTYGRGVGNRDSRTAAAATAANREGAATATETAVLSLEREKRENAPAVAGGRVERSMQNQPKETTLHGMLKRFAIAAFLPTRKARSQSVFFTFAHQPGYISAEKTHCTSSTPSTFVLLLVSTLGPPSIQAAELSVAMLESGQGDGSCARQVDQSLLNRTLTRVNKAAAVSI